VQACNAKGRPRVDDAINDKDYIQHLEIARLDLNREAIQLLMFLLYCNRVHTRL